MLKYLCPALCTVLYRPSLAASNATAYITWSPDMPLCRDSDRLPLSHLQWIRTGMLTLMSPDGRGAASRYNILTLAASGRTTRLNLNTCWTTWQSYRVVYSRLSVARHWYRTSRPVTICTTVWAGVSPLVNQNVGHPATLGFGSYWERPTAQILEAVSQSVCPPNSATWHSYYWTANSSL